MQPIIILPETLQAFIDHMITNSTSGLDQYQLTLNQTGLEYVCTKTTYSLPSLMNTFARIVLVYGLDINNAMTLQKVEG